MQSCKNPIRLRRLAEELIMEEIVAEKKPHPHPFSLRRRVRRRLKRRGLQIKKKGLFFILPSSSSLSLRRGVGVRSDE